MKLVSSQFASQPTTTRASDKSRRDAKPTVAAQLANSLQQRSPEPAHYSAKAWNITTRDDGAVVAAAKRSDNEGHSVSTTVTLVPPSTQTTGVKTIVMALNAAHGAPEFKITPFLFGDDVMAFGNGSYAPENYANMDLLPVVAAIRPHNEIAHRDAPGPGEMQTYTMRAIDSLITLDAGWHRFTTVPHTQSSTFLGSMTTGAPSATSLMPVASSHAGLSKAEVAGIGAGAGGLGLLVGVGAMMLFRRSQIAKRATETEQFSMKVLQSIDPEAAYKA